MLAHWLVIAITALLALVASGEPLSLLADALPPADDDGSRDFCFVSFGCWGGLNRATQGRVADVMARVVADAPAPTRFVIAAGDNFYRSGVRSVRDERFVTTFERAYAQPALRRLPFFVALGNHDYRGNFTAQVAYTQVQFELAGSAGAAADITGRWYLPHAYYAKRVARDTVVVVLDCPLLERCANNGDAHERCWDGGAQRAWAARQLEAEHADARWKIVVCHYPLHSNGPHVNHAWLVAWLQPLLERSCAALYINADNHYLQVSHVPPVFYVNSGGGAGFGVRHATSNKGYKRSPHDVFIAFRDGVFRHCVDRARGVLHSTAFNEAGEAVFTFNVSRSAASVAGACDAAPALTASAHAATFSDDNAAQLPHAASVAPAVEPPASASTPVLLVGVVALLAVVGLCFRRGSRSGGAFRGVSAGKR